MAKGGVRRSPPVTTIHLEAFAKVNLSLVVLGRRPDGFHEVDTILQTVDLSDDLEFSESDRLEFSCSDPSLPLDEGNLAVRAARALASEADRVPGARIRLVKRIPTGGGLGGGSSDAASTLLGLSALWGLGLGRDDLASVAGRLGSDVSFFLHGGTARGMGRGERIEELPDVPPAFFVLLVPPFGMPTPLVYKVLDTMDLTPFPQDGIVKDRVSGWPDRNDLEPAAERLRPELLKCRRILEAVGARPARLSGSGSAVFGRFPGRGEAEKAIQGLTGLPPGTRSLVAATVPRAGFRTRAHPAGPGGRGERRR